MRVTGMCLEIVLGTPLPIWKYNGECSQEQCFGSIADLEAASGESVGFAPAQDCAFNVACPVCGGHAERIPDVFDCWFESGSMPYAQLHYPFEKRTL